MGAGYVQNSEHLDIPYRKEANKDDFWQKYSEASLKRFLIVKIWASENIRTATD